jgi:hypothetical protein
MKGPKWFQISLVVLISFAVLVFANWVRIEGLGRSKASPLSQVSPSLPVIKITLLASDGSIQGESLAIGKVIAGTNNDFFWIDQDGVTRCWRGPVILQPTSYWILPDKLSDRYFHRVPDNPFVPRRVFVMSQW